ncbi:MAG: T9SS type A sorting domain-containing protein [Calditrichales bacterium]|nr:T9SS type A sorting domain-containing protein [Calditrichales bacterium]
MKIFILWKIILLSVLLFSSSIAQWSTNDTLNLPVCNEAGGQREPCMVNDGNGAVIIAWRDYRNEPILGGDIYVQKINISDGTYLWSTGGLKVNTLGGVQINPCIASDGTGGAILSWQKNNGGSGEWDIFSQRLDSDGNMAWGTGDVSISEAANAQEYPKAVSDGIGGVIIVWHDGQNTGTNQIYSQRIDASGNLLWPIGGALVTSANTVNGSVDLIQDGSGGIIAAWADSRGGDEDIYCQRLDASGNRMWGENDVQLCDTSYSQGSPVVVPDDESGVYIIWNDNRAGYGTSDLFAQRVDSSGMIQWVENGIGIINYSGVQGYHQAISDGNGGAIIVWEDNRVVNDADIFVQSINKMGELKWVSTGISVCGVDNNQLLPEITSDGAGCAIIAWLDYRYYNVTGDIYGQKIDSSGEIQWPSGGVPITTAENGQSELVLVSDNSEGAILSWTDRRNSPDYDIYAQRIKNDGSLGGVTDIGTKTPQIPNHYILEQNYPNPFNPSTNIQFSITKADFVNLTVYNILGQTVATLVNEKLHVGSYNYEFDGSRLTSGTYYYKLKAGSFTQVRKMVVLK